MSALVLSYTERSRSRSPRRIGSGFKLHISNLPVTYSQKNLHDMFSRFGNIEDIRIIRKGANGQPLKDSVYGFVVMSRQEDAKRALENLNAAGWTVSFGKEIMPKQIQEQPISRKAGLLESPVQMLAMPSLQAFQHNTQATLIMLLNNANPSPGKQMNPGLLEKLISDNHPSAFNLSGIPQVFQNYFLVREVWIGNISPSTEKKALYDAFKVYGEIEGIEMFSSKGFSFIKYRKVVSATRAYEKAQGILVEERPVKVAFADPTRRIDILGDSNAPEDPNFNPIDDDNFKNLYLGYSAGSFIPPESKLREIFSRYGLVKGIHIKQANGNIRPYAFVDFDKGEQAAYARRHLYIDDKDGIRRAELGDISLEISFKNTHNIVSRSGVKNGVRFNERVNPHDAQEVARRLLMKPPEFLNMIQGNSGVIPSPPPPGGFSDSLIPGIFPMHNMPNLPSLPNLAPNPVSFPQPNLNLAQPSLDSPLPTKTTEEDPNLGNVVWSGFMTRHKIHRVGIDATLVKGVADPLGTIYHLNITHRVQIQDVWKHKTIGMITLEASNETQEKEFNEYIAYFVDKQRAGFLSLKNHIMMVLPPTEIAIRLYPKILSSQLLGVFLDPTKPLERPLDPVRNPAVNTKEVPMSFYNSVNRETSRYQSEVSMGDPRLVHRMMDNH